MPTYGYICSKCDHQFDLSQSIKDEALKVCPREKCRLKTWGKGKVKRTISAGAGLIFKGTGFYITDYRSENYKESAKKEAGASSGGETKAAGDTKASSSSETKSSSDSKPSETKSTASAKTASETKAPSPAKSESKPSGSKKKN
jgi:putative FmdB family regulatory protein